jgi:NADH:ubiquinone reductase (H+-translocating)
MAVRRARAGVLVVGGGFAGAYVARYLRRGATVVDPRNFMLYTPLLPEAASGTLEPRHVVVPLRQMCPRCELVVGHARGLDEGRRIVTVATDNGELEYEYEQLVLAAGAVARVPAVPGLEEQALGFKDLAEAIHLRNHVLRQLESAASDVDPARRAAHLTFVFVGAGYAGVEALAELSDLVDDASRYYPELAGTPRRWVLVDAAPRILPETPPRLSEYAARELRGRGIDVRVGTTLEEAGEGWARLSDGERIETRTLVWTAGVRPNRIAAEWGLPVDEQGRVLVDAHLRVEGRDNVWALGDLARVPNAATPGSFDPPTSQHALRQARRLARNVEGELEPYRYAMLGMVATLGRYKGIADVLGLRLRGFPGWFVTRTYHLYQLPLLTRKLRVVTDWTTALLFRRDIAELGELGHPRRVGEAP